MSDTRRKRLLVVCPHPEGVAPGQRLKYEQYFDYLRRNGYDITVSPFMSRRFWDIVYRKGFLLEKIFWTLAGYWRRVFDLLRLPFYDGLYIFLWVCPFGPPLFEAAFCALNPKVVYDIDDMVFLKPQSVANPIVAMFKSRSRVTYLMKKAKHVITCTPKLDAFARQFNERTTDISSTIDTQAYCVSNEYANNKTLVLGWSGSLTTAALHLPLLKGVLRQLATERSIRFLAIGAASVDLEGVDVTAIPWRRETEVADLQRIDIGLYPLPDEEWVLGKSGLKALQYMAIGIPTVASAIGANFRVIENGVSGFLVKNDEEWLEVLRRLIDNPDLRRRIGGQGRERVVKYYSVEANQPRYLAVLDSVMRASGDLRSKAGL